MKHKIALLAILAITLAGAGVAFGQATTSGTVSITAEISPIAELTLGAATVDFPNTTPTNNGTLTAAVTTAVTANVRTAGLATLVATANHDLKSIGGDTIPIGNVFSSIDSDHGFFITGAQAMSTTGTTVGGGASGGGGISGSYTGLWTWTFTNQWTYKTGNYSATISYLLSAP
jgi:hypothetical protein